jgi:hypothetical protein
LILSALILSLAVVYSAGVLARGLFGLAGAVRQAAEDLETAINNHR